MRDELPPLEGTSPEEPRRSGERADLAPALAPDSSGMTVDLWKGLDIATIETLFAGLDIPPRSPALNTLWRRLVAADAAPRGDGESARRFAALRAEALYRSGLSGDIEKVLGREDGADPLSIVLTARVEIGLGNRRKACPVLQGIARRLGELPAALRRDAILALGLCAAAAGDMEAAGLSAAMAREDGLVNSAGLAALDALAAGIKPKPNSSQRISPIDYRLLELAGAPDLDALAATASPALLSAIVNGGALSRPARLIAGEAAARLNILSPDELAGLYRAAGGAIRDDLGGGGATRHEKAERRAALFVTAAAERDPMRKAQAMRHYLDEARASGDYVLALRTLASQLDAVPRAPDLAWFAETAIEIGLAAGRTERVLSWVDSGPGQSRHEALEHWLALVDIADPNARSRRGANLAVVEELAQRGGFSPEGLHRLATVLDALDYHVPVPLWDVASRTPQPDGGHLPDTGVLSELADAGKQRQFGRVVLLVLATVGPNGPEGAHVIALGDAIRALMRAGLGAEAHQLGLEALFAFWPRSSVIAAREGGFRRP